MIGKFVVFDGSDGCGKTTQVALAVEYLQGLVGKDRVVQTQDPGGTVLGSGIRKLLFEEVGPKNMATGVVDLLFLASHMQNAAMVVEPAIEAGKIVVCDRWWMSQDAYSTQREVPSSIALAYRNCHGRRPDIFIFLHGDVAAMLERARARSFENKQEMKPWSDSIVLQRIQNEFFDRCSHWAEFRPICVDGKSQADVWLEIREVLDVEVGCLAP